MLNEHQTPTIPIPGTTLTANLDYDAQGRLTRLSCAGRVYFERQGDKRIFDSGFVTTSELLTRDQLLRQVSTGDHFWVEKYAWDADGRVVLVDGVQIERDSRHRISACITPEGTWRYGYRGEFVHHIERDGEARRIKREADGRAASIKHTDGLYRVPYDEAGARTDIPALPATYHRDLWGRLWTITDENGAVQTTYLWDGYSCVGRIDGAPGSPLSAVFSLDLSGTPVRIITRDDVYRIPRDAYGEGLLACEGVPGLYGGVAYQGFYHYASRVLDPLSASFNMPDPFDGLHDDPRRAEGYHGSLLVEHPAAGPYAVCQHDPISRTDPTGNFSWWVLLTDLTWALSNNISGLFGLDFLFNFWGSVFTFWTGSLGAFFDREFFYSERAGTWGWRSDGVMGLITGGRAFAYQHQIWSPSSEFKALEEARVFVPTAPFRPTHYGTMLRGTPGSSDPFLLRGDTRLTAPPATAPPVPAGAMPPQLPLNWTRAGGAAEAVVPGSMLPYFPAGGLHFDSTMTTLVGDNMDCTLTEIEPSGSLSSGTVTNRIIIDIPIVERSLVANMLVLLSDTTPNVFITTLAAALIEGSRTRVYLPADIPTLGPTSVRLRGLGAPSPAENVNHGAATPPQYLDSTGTTQPYAANNVVRLSQGGTVLGAAMIDRLEAQLQIDAPLTNLALPLTVFTAQPLGVPVTNSTTLTANPLEINSSALPPTQGDVLLLTNGSGASLAVVVVSITGSVWTVDRPVTPALGNAGGRIDWQRLSVTLTPLGTRTDALEAGSTLTYRAEATRSAPNRDFVVVRDPTGKQAARAINTLAYDAIVLASALPGNTANPYSVERFVTQAPNLQNLTITRAQTLVLNPPVPDDAVALHLHQLNSTAPTAGNAITDGTAAINFTVAAGRAEFTIPAGTTLSRLNTVRPSGIVGLSSGGTVVASLVKKVRLSMTFDRTLTLAATNLEVVRLAEAGLRYDAIPQVVPAGSSAVAFITVKPTTSVPAANTRVQMPRFRVGEIVEVDYGSGTIRRYRIGVPAGDTTAPVEGLTLALIGDAAPPATLPATATIIRLEPTTLDLTTTPPIPLTGGSRTGIRGTPILAAGATTTNQAAFDVWAGDGLRATDRVGIVSDNVTHPAVIASINRIEVEFASLTPVANGAYQIVSIINPAVVISTTAASFTRDGGAIVITQQPFAVGSNLVLAVPYKNGAVTDAGKLHGGTVIIPDDDEDGELSRLDALKAHELTHTLQWEKFGPIFLFGFPMWILEGFVEQFTEVEMPPFSAYGAATLVEDVGLRTLEIATSAVNFAAGDEVELSWSAQQPGAGGTTVNVGGSGQGHIVTLGVEEPADSNHFRITAGLNIVPRGVVNVQVRRRQGSTPWSVVLQIGQFLSAGGLLNFAGGAVYGGLFNLIGRGMYALIRLIGGQGKTYPAAVEGVDADAGKILRVTDADGRAALAGAARIVIEKDGTSLVRTVERIDTEIVRLTQAITLTGEVRVAPYATHRPDSTFDWHQYYPASVPDASRPASVRIEPVGSDTLQLDPFDRVKILSGSQSYERTVTAVAGDTVELNERIIGSETVFRIAKIGEDDPIGNVDSMLMTHMGMDWLRWVFDPYSQLQYDLRPDPTSFGGVLARIGRYAFGSSSWSFVGLCVLILDRVRVGAQEHLARIEQDASGNSGDTYSPLGRRRGSIAVVGDVARYWGVMDGGSREFGTTIQAGMQDAAGVWQIDRPRVMTSLVAAPGTTAFNADVTPNGAITDPANDVPDVFFAKSLTDPTITNVTAPVGFMPATRGWIPTSPRLQRSNGLYAAFTRPGLHRITLINTVDGKGLEARQAQDAGVQTTWYDQNVQPVVVTVNGQPVNEGDTITLVQTQRAAVSITPNGARRYALTLLRPKTGAILRTPDDNSPLLVEAQHANALEEVEVTRFYGYNAERNTYEHPTLNKHGVHIPTDIHIPVRGFNIEVVSTLPVRNALSLDAAAIITELRPTQEAFILVPATIGPNGLRIASATAGGVAVPLAQLSSLIQAGPAELPTPIRAFVGDGGVFRLLYDPAVALLGEIVVNLTVEVGTTPFATLTIAPLTLRP